MLRNRGAFLFVSYKEIKTKLLKGTRMITLPPIAQSMVPL